MVTVTRLSCGNFENFKMLSRVSINFVTRYVHHLTQDMKDLLSKAKVPIPLLSPARWIKTDIKQSNLQINFSPRRHGFCDTEALDSEGHKICGAYREQVSCFKMNLFFNIFLFKGDLCLLPQQ